MLQSIVAARAKALPALGWRAVGIASLALAAALALGWFWFNSGRQPAGEAQALPPDAQDPSIGDQATVSLMPTQREAAGIQVAPAAEQDLQEIRRVPGKLDYNASRRLELKAPLEGVVKRMLVQPGQAVGPGDPLAVIDSSPLGSARDEVRKREADLAIARQRDQWCSQIAENVAALVDLVTSRPDMASVEQQFSEKLLGSHRETLVSAYSKHMLAEKIAGDLKSVQAGGAVSGRTLQERQSAREIAAAALLGACEQARFEATQDSAQAKAAVEQAQRLLTVARQRVAMLVGPYAEVGAADADGELCELVLRAPWKCTVAKSWATSATQVSQGQAIVELADTDVLWVTAQLYQRDLAALPAIDTLRPMIELPSLNVRQQLTAVKFLGSSVDDETHAVPLVGELDNASQRYKPGMFVWVSLPVGAPRRSLAVPASAVLRHEKATFVFVEEPAGTFRKVDVETGKETPDWIEIVSGIAAGQAVVNQGAFFLKSELLLANEAE